MNIYKLVCLENVNVFNVYFLPFRWIYNNNCNTHHIYGRINVQILIMCYLQHYTKLETWNYGLHILEELGEKLQYISNLFPFRTERNFTVQISEHCYFSLRCDVRLSCILVTTVSINSGITTPLTSMKFATDLITVVSLILPDEALLTDNIK